MQITLLIGLPASGKTHIAKQLLGETKEFIPSIEVDDCNKTTKKYIGENGIIMDDIRQVEDLPKPGEFEHLIITDVYFCLPDQRDKAIHYLADYYYECNPNIVLVFFENSPEKCLANSRRRDNDEVVLNHIKILSEGYEIPEGIPLQKIWQPKPSLGFNLRPFKINGKTIEFV